MKSASILLALVVLGGCREHVVNGWEPDHDYSLTIADYRFGFDDGHVITQQWRHMYLGPLGDREVPFTATQGLIGCCCILAVLIILPVLFTVGWKRKHVAP